ncbi:hypothetical protein D9615_007795 [Tricholomella constricta]|uniref:Protein kinase domain-containing protein n=1 Tax=Tricholomella constricta TaxID=117010 RepID=A0A8H5H4U1_9AGAR|nr:hypothetical protein D9615_007795 [Tricholomella constricta]
MILTMSIQLIIIYYHPPPNPPFPQGSNGALQLPQAHSALWIERRSLHHSMHRMDPSSYKETMHFRSSSYPSSIMSSFGHRISSAMPHRNARSDTASRSSTSKSSPRLSPSSSPGYSHSNLGKEWKSISRPPSLEHIVGPSLSPPSSPKATPSKSLLHRLKSTSRPWASPPHRSSPLPKEQTERWHHTRMRVARAVSPMIDITVDVAHDVLANGAELLKFAPIPGLDGAAKVLLGIWDALQKVTTNRLACLRLTDRCAEILIAIHEEISRVGDTVAKVLSGPLEDLEHAFGRIHQMLQDLINQSLFIRYLKRDDVLRDIADCNTMLQDCLGHFDRSIQLRILKYVTATSESPGEHKLPSPDTDLDDIDLDIKTLPPSKEEIHEKIRTIQDRQNERDRFNDIVEFERIYGKAEDDRDALEILGVEKPDIPDAIKTLLRALEQLRIHNVVDKLSTSLPSPRRSSTWPVDRFEARELSLVDREFIERELQALKSAYKGPLPTLPSWTITKFEVDLGELIGRGFFSTVYKGSWNRRSVAVKVLDIHTSKESFINEINVWKALSHRNVLELYGASSAEGPLPWFLVSPLMKHGSLTDYLKRVDWEAQRHVESGDAASAAMLIHEKVDYLRKMHDIAEGMRYLHEHGVYHGDLKAANVLVSDVIRCVISDFGQSKWKSHVMQGNSLPNHAMRWQAPELMSGHSLLTKKIDIYAFAMCCVEVLTMGSIPWPTMNDEAVRRHVLDEQGRPPFPDGLVHALGLEHLLRAAWHQSPSERPPFRELAPSLFTLRNDFHSPSTLIGTPRIVISQPNSFSNLAEFSPRFEVSSPDGEGSFVPPSSPRPEYSTPYLTVIPSPKSEDETIIDAEYSGASIPLQDSLLLSSGDIRSPSTVDDRETIQEPYHQTAQDHQFEFTYRVCLSHEFPPSLNLPLWTPGDAMLGDVGYLDGSGQFVKLLNSLSPEWSSGGRLRDIQSITHFGRITLARRQQREKNAWKKLITFSSKTKSRAALTPDQVKKRRTFSLSGGRVAFLCAEKTVHHAIEDVGACKQWFCVYWEHILRAFGREHELQKEDLMLIVETLTAQDYALFVNHGHVDQEAHFDVQSPPRDGEPWGTFELPQEEATSPSQRQFFSKVSTSGGPSKTILVARLRFQPDVKEPTLLA